MTLYWWWIGAALAAPNWVELASEVEAKTKSAVIIKVLNSDTSQAPMVHMKIDGVPHEMPCADDGSFPDTAADDGVFHCANTVSMGLVEGADWTASFSIRAGNGKDQALGTLIYPKGGGYRFATLMIGNAESASAQVFDLPSTDAWSKGVQLREAGAQTIPTPPEPVAPVNPEPPPAPAPPGGHPDHALSFPSSNLHAWAWIALAGLVGWSIGRRGRERPLSARVDGTRVMPCPAIDENGPAPGDAVTIAATDIHATFNAVLRGVTGVRRLVVVGDLSVETLRSGHDVLHGVDPDGDAIIKMLEALHSDGGVPPVLCIMGRDTVLDTSGMSGEPLRDLLDAVKDRTWVVVLTGSDESALDGTDAWSHDPQAGWSRS